MEVKKPMKIQESGENYLETILILEQKKGSIRSIDIANELEFTKPSISRAMSLLRENNYITMDDGGLIHLTGLGRELAVRIYVRHQVLSKLLPHLGVAPQVARTDACRSAHVISQETFDRIREHAERYGL